VTVDGDPDEETPPLSSFARSAGDGRDGDSERDDGSRDAADSDTAEGGDCDPADPPGRDGGDSPVDADPASFVAPADLPREETVELGVELLAATAEASLPLPEAVDRVETVTGDPTLVREILDTAETRGVIEREGASVRSRVRGQTVELDRRVVRREGDYDCRRCGKSLSTGHFVRFETGEVGPFGSSCVRKVTGRE
jgi:hypothetical protein